HMTASVLHEFHLIMTELMREKLLNLTMFGPRHSLSGVIAGILSCIDPFIIKEHSWGKQRMSRYRAVSDDPDEIRVHTHVYFTGDEYRKIKLLHADLNCYSIAQLVRWLLEVFLAMVERYGKRVLEEFEKRFKQWSSEERKLQQSPRRKIRQLYRIIQHLPGRNRMISVYTNQFSPFWILRL
ncbi:MAG: hypothetical protein JW881_12195, partial [Spirochaetales bacterium]|nr:hypothetical protein [Spirochaetales bacterium]